MASNIPVIVQGNSFSLAIPLQIYYINGDQMDLEDYTPDPTDEVTIQLKGSRRNYTYTPTIDGNVANIDLTGNELADNYGVVVSVVKANGQRLRSFRTDQFFIVESSDDLTPADIIEGLEENVIYLNAQPFIAGADGRGIESIVKTSTAGLVDTYTITYTDATTSTFDVTNGAAGQQGADGVGITSIEKTSTSGLVDTYTITLSNGNTSTFEVTNGKDGVDLGLAEIADNLTTDDPAQVLSARQGKVLNERLTPVENVLDINSSSAEVSERIGYEQNNGFIAGQTPSTNNAYRYSDPILLKAGESLKMKAITPTSVWRLSSYNPTTQKYSKILSGASSGTSSAADAYENTYTATDDIYVVVSWFWNFYQLELTKTYNKTTTTSKVDDVDAIADALDLESATETKTEDLAYTEKVGAFRGGTVGKQAAYETYSNYRTTNDFLLRQGDTLQITAKNVATNISLLVNLDGTLYRTLIVGNNSDQSATYTAPVDGYYAVTWFASQGVTLKVTTTRTTTDSERIATIEGSTTQIPALAESVAGLKDAVFENVSDGMTTDFVDGYFINHNGEPMSNSIFAYKEFVVKAGAVIQGQVYSHPNFAILAKKIDTGIYEELVAGTSYTFESFSYTALENMTIAVTFTKSKDRSITIDTDNVESNTINIDNILSGMDAINKRAETPDYGMFFDKVAVIGDSLTVGTLDGLTGGHAAGGSFNCSWLTYLAKKWGSTIRMHYGRGGTTCYDWIGNNDYGLGLMLKDSDVYDVYFVAYGHNDAGGFTIGTTSDTPTAVTVDADNNVSVDTPAASTTFLGNYKKIVNEIREKAPNALIFLVSTDKKDSTAAGSIGYMNQFIEELAEWYYEQGDHRVFYIDYANKLNIANETAGYHTGGHFSTFGYAYVANIINDCVNEVIYANLSSVDIKEWGKFIGAGYRTTEIDTTTSGGYLPHL
jgi:lysophospholipase L1-like esterase